MGGEYWDVSYTSYPSHGPLAPQAIIWNQEHKHRVASPSDGISYRQNRRIVSSTSGARDKASYISNST